MLHRAGVGAERVLVTGASGGVGSAAVQLARRRGAEVIAVCAAAKADEVRALGADRCIDRGADLAAELGRNSIDVAIDMVGGPGFPALLDVLRPGGRYAVAGAIAGPICELDLRTVYLKDLTLHGCTFQEDEVFANLIRYVEAGEIRPVAARTYPLADIAEAQRDFLSKKHTGKLVLIPPQVAE
jgi:NADPH:quinone reductase-like Zn-dependent oxidoreductase